MSSLPTAKSQTKLGPYELNTIVTGDARECLAELPDKSIHAVITDPPYFTPAVHYQSRVNFGRKWADMSIMTHWWAMFCKEIGRVLMPNGYCLTFCKGDSMAAFYPPMFEEWDTLQVLVWDKDRIGLGALWRHQHELILAARNKSAYLPNDGKMRGDILKQQQGLTRDREHPVEKPEALLMELIKATTPENGIVLDPFAGSGSTLCAAHITNRRWLGFELSSEYAEAARRRTKNADLPLFVDVPQQLEFEEVAQ